MSDVSMSDLRDEQINCMENTIRNSDDDYRMRPFLAEDLFEASASRTNQETSETPPPSDSESSESECGKYFRPQSNQLSSH